MGDIVRALTPEARELEKKKEALSALEAELAEKELEILTLHADLRAFEQRYLRVVGVLYAELDELQARIAEAEARHNPEAADTQRFAADARARAEESAREVGGVKGPASGKFEASDDLKRLYKEVAKRMHPDLTTDEDERKLRNKFFVEANLAYEAGDMERLRTLLAEWETRPESVTGEGLGADLVRIIRKIAQVEGRLSAIEAEIAEARQSELHSLMKAARETEEIERDLLAAMADDARRKIEDARKRLAKIVPGGDSGG